MGMGKLIYTGIVFTELLLQDNLEAYLFSLHKRKKACFLWRGILAKEKARGFSSANVMFKKFQSLNKDEKEFFMTNFSNQIVLR